MCVGIIHTDVTDVFEIDRPFRETFRLVWDTRGVSGTPKMCKGHKRHFRDTTVVSKTPPKGQGHQRAA